MSTTVTPLSCFLSESASVVTRVQTRRVVTRVQIKSASVVTRVQTRRVVTRVQSKSARVVTRVQTRRGVTRVQGNYAGVVTRVQTLCVVTRAHVQTRGHAWSHVCRSLAWSRVCRRVAWSCVCSHTRGHACAGKGEARTNLSGLVGDEHLLGERLAGAFDAPWPVVFRLYQIEHLHLLR